MTDLALYHFPRGCSRVTMTALEQCGADYQDHVVNLMRGGQHDPAYRAINPRGKIPALVVDGAVLAENGAILLWLDQQFPQAGLLPAADDWIRAQAVSDLFWFSSGWHIAARCNMMPVRFTNGDPAPVRERGKELFAELMAQFEARMAGQDWWLGEAWSILDVYCHWCYTTAEAGGFDLSTYPAATGHRARVSAWPAFAAASAREEAAIKSAGMEYPA